MHSFEAVYARMLFAAGVRTQTELAKLLGMKQASISEAKKRKSIPAEWCMRLYDACGVRFDWQRFGTGSVYDAAKIKEIEAFRLGAWRAEAQTAVSYSLREPETPFRGFAEHDEAPVYSTFQMPDGSFPEIARRCFPSEFLPEGAKVFRILDGSMAPVLNKGAMLAVMQGLPAEEGKIAAVFAGRELVFRKVVRGEACWELWTGAGQAERSIPDGEWPNYYYGKAVWLFQPL